MSNSHKARQSSGQPMRIMDRRSPGFFWAYDVIFDEWGYELKPLGIAVYLCLCRFAGKDSQAWPSLSTLAQRCGMSRRAVVNTLNRLESLGFIERERRRKGAGDMASTLYYILDIPPFFQPGSAPGALGVVHHVHQGSAPGALGVVHHVHQGSASGAHEGIHIEGIPTEGTHTQGMAGAATSEAGAVVCVSDDKSKDEDIDRAVAQAVARGQVHNPAAYRAALLKAKARGEFVAPEKPKPKAKPAVKPEAANPSPAVPAKKGDGPDWSSLPPSLRPSRMRR